MTAKGITLSEGKHPLCFLISEDSDGAGFLSREGVVISVSQDIAVGQILAKQAIAALVAVAAAANAGNTGNGALTLASPAYGADVKGGDYRVVYTDATHFLVEDPNGNAVGEGVNGTAFTKEVKFTIATGGTAFVAGDGFTINADVQDGEMAAADDVEYVAWAPGAIAAAIAGYPCKTDASNKGRITAINAHATVRLEDLTFGGSPTTAQRDQAMRDLEKKLIKFR